ncbi:MAG: hypothetical protein ACKOK8_01375, partial [Planctomycetia bacterium]
MCDTNPRSARLLAGLLAGVLFAAAGDAAEPAANATPQKAVPKGAAKMPTEPADEAPQNPAVAGRLPDDHLPTTDREWQRRLTPEQYQVTRKKGT